MKTFKVVDGNEKLLTIMANDGWSIVNTFPNPYPEPYFFALMELNQENSDQYDVDAVKDLIFNPEHFKQLNFDKWLLDENNKSREEYKKAFRGML